MLTKVSTTDKLTIKEYKELIKLDRINIGLDVDDSPVQSVYNPPKSRKLSILND